MKQTTRYHRWLQAVVACTLILLPVLVQGQAVSVDELVERARNAGVSMEQVEALQERAAARGIGEQGVAGMLRPAVELAERELPGEMVLQKAMEGMAKNISPARMNPVLQQMQASTEAARPLVDDWMGRPEVDELLGRGVDRFDRESFRSEMLRVSARAVSGEVGLDLVGQIMETMLEEGVMRHATPARVVAAIHILPDMPGVAERPDHARSVVEHAVRGGFEARDLQQLPGAMQMAQRRSQMPGEAVMEGVGRQLERGSPASDILQNLFEGRVGGGPPGHAPGGLEGRPGRSGERAF